MFIKIVFTFLLITSSCLVTAEPLSSKKLDKLNNIAVDEKDIYDKCLQFREELFNNSHGFLIYQNKTKQELDGLWNQYQKQVLDSCIVSQRNKLKNSKFSKD